VNSLLGYNGGMIILFDLDGTLAHFDREFDRHLNERFGHLVDIPRSHNQITFDLFAGRSAEESAAINDIMDYPGFYRHLQPMEGGVEAVREAEALGHEVFFVTAPWRTNRSCLQDKADWVAEHFGEKAVDQLIFAKKKHLIIGDILFDDKSPIEHADQAVWTQVFVHQPYNKDAKGLRIHSWDDWKDVVVQVQADKLAAEAAKRNESWDTYIDLGEFKYS